MGFFDKLKRGLEKTRKSFTEKIGQVIMGYAKIDDDLLDDLEAIMISSDMGVKTTETLMEEIRKGIKKKEITGPSDLRPFLQKKIAEMFAVGEKESYLERPLHVIMVVGVNGVGKTTTIAKLGNYYREQGKKVVFAAADTFRAAAIDQLEIWGQRIALTLSSIRKVPILRLLRSMLSRHPKREKPMCSSSIQQVVSIRNRI